MDLDGMTVSDALYKQLSFSAANEDTILRKHPDTKVRSIVPKPGFCIKTRTTDNNRKVFINICTGENIPAPKQITDEELVKLLELEDPTGFRVPMSLGEPHAELDNSGKGCTAYDVVISPEFFQVIRNREVMQGFFLTVALEGLEAKYNLSLDRNWSMLKNRKFLGSLPEQNIRTQSKPWIMEMDEPTPAENLISEVKQSQIPATRATEPPYTLIQEPAEGYPEYVVSEIHLPNIKAASSLILDLGADRILLETRSNVYRLDIYLPYNMIQEECGAQFNRASKILTITMPVEPQQ